MDLGILFGDFWKREVEGNYGCESFDRWLELGDGEIGEMFEAAWLRN